MSKKDHFLMNLVALTCHSNHPLVFGVQRAFRCLQSWC